jgi:hypothetical protein
MQLAPTHKGIEVCLCHEHLDGTSLCMAGTREGMLFS